jgi:hypothetical protein
MVNSIVAGDLGPARIAVLGHLDEFGLHHGHPLVPRREQRAQVGDRRADLAQLLFSFSISRPVSGEAHVQDRLGLPFAQETGIAVPRSRSACRRRLG